MAKNNGMTVKIQMDSSDKILLKRGLQKDGTAQKFFTSEVARLCDPYVPMDTGALKDTKDVKVSSIVYVQPYAARQYNTNVGKGLRGKYWDKRMWADRGNEIVRSVQAYLKSRG